jgi:3,4-dihydroxy 2-butanone 4-phosphate synthase/GTP cyclohydrolase II
LSFKGVSSRDRSVTFKALADPSAQAKHFTRPGHVFPLVARQGGILERRGHTEATVDLCILSGLNPVGLLAEIMNEDGTMSRLMDCVEFAEKYQLAIITVEHLASYRSSLNNLSEKVPSVEDNKKDSKVELVASCKLPIQR